ncbi:MULTISPECIES: type 1 glutamine amidotransferase domain-containing protein [unclassified Sporolactobacillus]|uniref:type 1 glutamine amidotransferase domain-containing protein n=1 Tax=unclassified Sporolactobacillus TaxID=2628533 RepID=UPI002368570D|nr:type 1 glutamine amidotransferase domain-containing protein [Sporolactobacillus sp. CQH2019]MDD9150367.1 type 1 glutamine amidotransferase [Sporolactobacillus sp. CQH2019]
MAKKVAAVLANDFEDVEFTAPADAYKKAGHTVTVIGTEKGATIIGKHGTKVTADASIDDVRPEDFDALLIAGGYSPDNLRGDSRFVAFAKAFMDADKSVFAICHGPQLLITAETLKDRNVTGYKSIAVDLKNAGAKYHDEEVVVCHNLVTSRTPDDIPAFNRESLKALA